MSQERVVRINVDPEAPRRAVPPPAPSDLGERLQAVGRAAAPVIQAAFDAAFASLNRLRR